MGGREGKMVGDYEPPCPENCFWVQREWKSRGKQGERDHIKIFSETSSSTPPSHTSTPWFLPFPLPDEHSGNGTFSRLKVQATLTQPFEIAKNDSKIVYVAPMKPLAAEIVEKMGWRLSWLGIQVRELYWRHATNKGRDHGHANDCHHASELGFRHAEKYRRY